jgi:PAS domain S-box-containing protein
MPKHKKHLKFSTTPDSMPHPIIAPPSEALRQSEERYRLIFEQCPMALQIFNQDGHLQAINPACVQLLGFLHPEEAYGFDLFNYPNFPASLPHVLLEGRALRYEFEFDFELVKTQKLFTTSRSGAAVFDLLLTPFFTSDTPLMPGVLMHIQEITDRKRAEQEKFSLEEQLRQSKKMEMIGLLAGGVAHDFNNLLSPILGYADLLLLKAKPNEPDYETLQIIKHTAEKASQLTRQLLALSRKQILNPTLISLNDLILDFSKMLKPFLGETIALQTHLNRQLYTVQVDTAQIQQVLMNLAINAREAMPQGGVFILETSNAVIDEVFCRTHAGMLPGEYIQLNVSDTGCGMEPETRARIFEPFFTTKAAANNTGLGLAISYGIVKQHNGHIWAYSEPGHGTTFSLFFPAIPGAAPAATPATKSAKSRWHGRETILLVEDEALVRKLAEDILTIHGYTVFSAQDGFEALQLVRETKPEIALLISDVIMPGMNGRELYQRLLPFYPRLNVLFISGYTQNVLTQQGGLKPEMELLQKPFTIQALLEKVRALIDHPNPPPH